MAPVRKHGGRPGCNAREAVRRSSVFRYTQKRSTLAVQNRFLDGPGGPAEVYQVGSDDLLRSSGQGNLYEFVRPIRQYETAVRRPGCGPPAAAIRCASVESAERTYKPFGVENAIRVPSGDRTR
jgi:hypothetical protein